MKIIALDEDDINFLLGTLSCDEIRHKLLQALDNELFKPKTIYSAGKCELLFEETEIAAALDDLSYALTKFGLNENHEPNDTGHCIERLIDILYLAEDTAQLEERDTEAD